MNDFPCWCGWWLGTKYVASHKKKHWFSSLIQYCICRPKWTCRNCRPSTPTPTHPDCKNLNYLCDLDLLTWKWYATHHPLRACICATYDGQTDQQSDTNIHPTNLTHWSLNKMVAIFSDCIFNCIFLKGTFIFSFIYHWNLSLRVQWQVVIIGMGKWGGHEASNNPVSSPQQSPCWLDSDYIVALTHWGRMTHICVTNIGHQWFRQWLVACSAPIITWLCGFWQEITSVLP